MPESPDANRLRVLAELLHGQARATGEHVTLTFQRDYAVELAETLDRAAEQIDAGSDRR